MIRLSTILFHKNKGKVGLRLYIQQKMYLNTCLIDVVIIGADPAKDLQKRRAGSVG